MTPYVLEKLSRYALLYPNRPKEFPERFDPFPGDLDASAQRKHAQVFHRQQFHHRIVGNIAAFCQVEQAKPVTALPAALAPT